MANVENFASDAFLPHLPKRAETKQQIAYEGNTNKPLIALLCVCFMLGLSMWAAFFMWLF